MKYTIIITVYNKEKYLENALKSACNQTYKDYQIIVVNDGSTDNSERIIKKYLKSKKIKYFKKENTGIADTRNYAIEKVETQYFMFLDADDYISTELLEKIDKYKDYDILSFNAINIENNKYIKKMNKPKFKGNGENFFKKLVAEKSEFTVPWGYVYNTKYFKNNNYKYPKGKILEDFYLTPFIILDAKKIVSIDYCGYYYINSSNSIMTSNSTLISNTYFEHYEQMTKRIQKYSEEIQKEFNSFLAGILIWYGNEIEKKHIKNYMKRIKQQKILDLLIPKSRKRIMKILYNTNMYYKVRNIIKKIY